MSCCRIARRNIRLKFDDGFLCLILYVVVCDDALFVGRSVGDIGIAEYMDDFANAWRSFLLNAPKMSSFDTR